jgi:hypothetical protein
MSQAFLRAAGLILSPSDAWRVAAERVPAPLTTFASFLCPLACVPALSWTGGRMLSGEGQSIAQMTYGGVSMLGGTLMSVAVLAAALYVLAPLFACQRDWPRAFQVGSYSSAPVLLGGAVLLVPGVEYVMLLALFHGAYLLYAGVQTVLGVKEDRAAEYVALATVLFIAASTVLGGVAGALGVL